MIERLKRVIQFIGGQKFKDMSLDVYLEKEVWVSYDRGKTYKVDYEEIYSDNITHNLTSMAEEAGLYEALWRPYNVNEFYVDIDKDFEIIFEDSVEILAQDIIEIIERGLEDLKARPEHFKKFNSENGWGMYENFVPFVTNYLEALKNNPEAIVTVTR